PAWTGRSGARAAAASPAASSTPRRCCPARPAARSSTPTDGCSASTPTASARAFTWPYPPTRRCGPKPTRSPAASQRRHRSLASLSPPLAWPGGCAAPSAGRGPRAGARPTPEGGRTARDPGDGPAARAGLASGDLIVAAAGQPVGGVDDLFGALQGAQGGTLELGVVRGSDERTVQVV